MKVECIKKGTTATHTLVKGEQYTMQEATAQNAVKSGLVKIVKADAIEAFKKDEEK